MPHTIFLAPVDSGCGLTSLALGLVRALDKRGIRVAFCKPIGQSGNSGNEQSQSDRSPHFIRATTSLRPTNPISLEDAEKLMRESRWDELLEKVIRIFHESVGDADVAIIEGLVPHADSSYAVELNVQLARALSSEIILASSATQITQAEVEDKIEIAAQPFGGIGKKTILGFVINRFPSSTQRCPQEMREEWMSKSRFLPSHRCRLIGVIPENSHLTACRTVDICRYLKAEILHEGALFTRRAKKISLLARTVPNMMHTFVPGAILITPADRSDVILGVAMAALNRIPLAGLILTGDTGFNATIMELCKPAWETDLPVLRVPTNSWETATHLSRMSNEIPIDDIERARETMEFVSTYIDADWIADHTAAPVEVRMSPAAFCFRITELAKKNPRRIILPEGDEPRTIRAAAICAQRNIAQCILLGKPEAIRLAARHHEIDLPDTVELMDAASIREKYISPLVQMRESKGLTPKDAAELLEDNVWLGTVMLALGEVDGLVSGAVHSSANTIRPALQIIKTRADAKVVSSIFFMCLPEQVLIYGDCAVNPNPDAETLADIALQSAESALQFGIPARVAMISYSTGKSGFGADVEKVREATAIAKAKNPKLLLDGPLQYDAAAIPEVAEQKAPHSPVAGKATIFIFPDLNTGNTTYKAVQRSAHVISIGPMLQGLKRPVNDLSRGALIEDIVYTIALTAIQAAQKEIAPFPGIA
ncbi:MAG: phosphate acetyltransferase [Verrucomicrobia bacterium]|nr:MAG: phosphate acetyltransferase [Verrucomicrobiota bacterium]